MFCIFLSENKISLDEDLGLDCCTVVVLFEFYFIQCILLRTVLVLSVKQLTFIFNQILL